MPVFREIDLREINFDWGLEQFLDLTENGHRSLVVRHAFDPARASDDTVAPLDGKIKYTTEPVDFKTGRNYRSVRLRRYLSLIDAPEDFYCSWGISSMNDQPEAMEEFRLGAQCFVDKCLDEGWSSILSTEPEANNPGIIGHFIAGNTTSYGVRTQNHYVLSLNHVFQINGEKTWYLSDASRAMAMPQFFQYSPMEFKLGVTHKEYVELPFVEKLITRPGDFFYNAPLVGHAVAMGPGKNLMLSIRKQPRDFVIRPELHPLLYRAVSVTRAVIHADVDRFRRWAELMPAHDNAMYGDGAAVPRSRSMPNRVLSAVLRRLRGK